MVNYVKHLDEVFKRAGVDKTPENRDALDRIIREELGMEHNDSEEVWEVAREKILLKKDPALVKKVIRALCRHALLG